MRAAAYVRLSEETDTTTSPARQRDLCAKYAELRGWTITATFEDIDVSASKTGLDRPALGRLREAVTRGEIDVVLVWRLDRLARSALDTLTILKEWQDLGCAVASATEAIDLTTGTGKAMATLIAVFAEMESDAIKVRVAGAIDRMRRDGRFAGGTVPFGYVPVANPGGAGRVLALDGAEATVVREVADMVVAGHSLGRVARLLNERGVPAPRSEHRRLARSGKSTEGADPGVWRVQSLRRLLVSDHLAGRVTHRGQVIRDETGMPATIWEPILDPAVLHQLRALLEPEGAPQERRVRQARLLSGLAYCAACGAKMYVQAADGRPLYGCPSRRNGVVCPSPRISAPALERYVAEAAIAMVGPRMLTRTVPMATESAGVARGVSFQEVERAIADTTAGLQADDADVPALLARLAALKETRAELRAAATPVVFHVVQETGLTWAEAFNDADDEGRRLMLADEIDAVRIRPTTSRSRHLDVDRVEIVWSVDN